MKFFYRNSSSFFFLRIAGNITFSVLFIAFFLYAHSAPFPVYKKIITTEAVISPEPTLIKNSTLQSDFFANNNFAAPPVLSLNPSDYNGFNISCNGENDGSIDLTITGGLPPFDILWSNSATTEDISNLTAGNYSVRVIDANNDTVISDIDLIQPDPIGITVDTVSNVSCNGGADGTIEISVTGGVSPFGFLWSDGSTDEDLSNVISGTYSVTVTDNNGCTGIKTDSILQPAALTASTSSINSTCGSANGTATVTPSGGTPPYSFLWSDAQTTQTATGLLAGTFSVTVTDSNNCFTNNPAIVSNTPGPDLLLDSVINEKCFGDNMGGIFVSVSGGTAPINFTWSNSSTVEDLQNISAGNYSLIVTDSNGCIKTLSQLITQPDSIRISFSLEDETCGNANGTASAGISGGINPFSFLWSNSETTSAIDSLPAGTYTLTVTDSNFCIMTDSVLINNLSELTVLVDSVVNENCFGDANGGIFISIANGASPFSYSWSDASTNEDLSNVISGTYSVTVTDNNGCTGIKTDSVLQPLVLTASTSSINSTCGNPNGTATATPSGGTSPYSYLWSDTQTAQTATGLAAATYTVTITDAHGCTFVISESVSNTAGPVLALDSVHDEICFGDSNGDIFISFSGGTSPFGYLWSNSSTDEDLQNVIAGTYSIIITDNNSCTDTLTATINEPAAVSGTTSSVNSTCGNANGTATVTPSGGTSPYSYLWSNAQTTQTATGLSAITYTVTVTDNHGCTFVTSETVSNTPGPVLALDSIHDENCFGDANGDIFISFTGGTGTMDYLWTNGVTTEDLQNVSAGAYTVTITDDNSCTATLSAIITQPSQAGATTSSVNSTCGNANGSATANPSGGTNPYTYLWSDGQTIQTATGLLAGTYTVTVTDNHGCTFVTSETVSNTPGPIAVLDSVHTENCFGDSNGDIFISLSGGTAPFNFLWSNSSTNEDLQNVPFGNYTVTVTDNNSCTATLTAFISQPQLLTASTSTINSTCGSANGSATATPSGGTNPYFYLWSNAQTTQTATGLLAGNYSVTVTDNNGCTVNASVSVSVTSGPSLTLDSVKNENCFGQSIGGIFISVTGGTPPVNYLWSNSSTSQDLQNVPAGNYSVTVTDNNNCTVTHSNSITEPPLLTATSSSVNSTCGDPNGTATVTPAGGTNPYSYLWSNAQTTQTATGLLAGTYTVTVTDNQGCTLTISEIVFDIPGPSIVLDSIHNELCFGNSNGDIFISLSGGTSPFNYLWSNASTSQDLQNVFFGNYTVTVTDNNACTASLTAFISQPQLLTAATSSSNSTCGGSNGSATATPSGGTNPYSYLWSNSQTSQTAAGLLAGTYIITVTDNNGCTFVTSETVSNTGGPVLALDSVHNENCFGDTNGDIFISFIGGTGTMDYQWSNGSTVEDLQNVVPGTYTVTITDDNNCTATLSGTITQPSQLSATTSSLNSTCGNANGSATVNPTGGTLPYSYLWSNAQTTQTAVGLTASPYTVTVTDAHGCSFVTSQTVSNTPGPVLALDSIYDENCFGDANGDIFISVIGGTGTIDYLWSDASTSQNLQNVVAGTYTVTVTDDNNCTATVSAAIGQPSQLNVSTSSAYSTCGNANGTATATPSGGISPYTYLWSNAQTTQTAIALFAGNYSVTVNDAHGCSVNNSVSVIVISGPSLSLDSVKNENCFGQSIGGIFISVSGGTAPVNYLWSNSSTSGDLQNVPAGNYSVTVTDNNNCTVTLASSITEPQLLAATTSSGNSTCGNANGTATVNPTGGTNPYSYSWSNAQTSQTLTALSAGLYTVTITDNNGCTVSASENVSDTPGPVATAINVTDASCYGFSDGSINVNTNNGTPPLSYLWSNGATTEDISNLATGNYTVTVTDFNLCISSTGEFVDQPDSISISMSMVPAMGIPNGSITTIISGGTPGYSFLWSTGATTQNISGLYPGTYTLTVTDNNSCISNRSGVVTSGVICNVAVDSTHNTSCYNGNDGAVYITVTGAFAPLTFAWSNGDTTEDITNLAAGTYTVTVTDFVNCSTTTSAVITQPDSITISFTSSDETCGSANGSITANTSGGTNPHTFLWSTSATTQAISNISAGTYTLTVTDGNNCIKTDSATIINLANPVASLDSVHDANCFGDVNGDIFISVTGGTGTMDYLWSNFTISEDLQNVAAGIYTVTVTDDNSCTATLSAAVSEPSQFTAAISTNNSTCGNANGSATANPSGGISPYSYLWSDSQTTQTATALAAATYTVTVTDAHGCTFTTSQTVSNTTGPIVAQDSIHDENCFGDANGDIFISVTGGTGSMDYLWSNASTAEDLQDVIIGTYTVTVTDDNSCTATVSATIGQPSQLSATSSFTNSTCGNSNGSATANPAGGVSPYSYLWSNSQTTQTAAGLIAATYTVTITDSHGCTFSTSQTVTNTSGPVVAQDSIHDENCFGDSNGDIFISVTGGTGTMDYLWSNSSNIEDLQNVVTGTYTVTVTDDNSCTATLSATISQPLQLTASASSVNSTCGNANGSATANPSGGTSPYLYLWSNSQTTQTATGLAAAIYTVTVTDSHGCTVATSETVSNTAGPIAGQDSIHDENCFGDANGDIFISVTGGTGTIDYLWSNASSAEDLQNVIAGTYTVTVTDDNGCTATLSATIAEPSQLTATTSSTNSTCGNANGTATVTPSGGTTAYSYLWSDAQTTQTATGLSAATYTVTVTDAHACTFITSQTVSNASGPVIALDSIHDENCFGDSIGDIFISVTGGTGTIDYLWSDASTAQDLQNVIAGTYTVTVTDDNNCIASLSASVAQPLLLTAATSSANSTCGNSNGTATVTPSGGTAAYSYLWSNSQTTQTATGLTAATYTVTVTDAHGCTFATSETVSNAAGPLPAQDSIHDENCFGDANGDIFISVTGGTGTMDYLWSDASTAEDLLNVITGIYTVTVTDDNGCTATLSAAIGQPSQLTATASSANSTCGNANGSSTANPTGGVSPYSYLWSDSQTTQTATGLTAATYTVTITDSHGCTFSTSQTVTNTSGPVVAQDSIHDENCFGDANGDIFISVTGGTGTMDYQWSNSSTIEDLQNVVTGTYTVTVTDDNNCTAALSATISQPSQLSATTSSANSTCGNPNGSATANPSGGTSPYSYLWSNSQTTQTATGLTAATYTVTVSDAHGCTFITSQTVANTTGPIVAQDSIHDENCFGDANGDIFISVTGGTGTMDYLWSDASTIEDLQNVAIGTYTVTVTDDNGCTAALSASITQPPPLSATTSSGNSTCGNANGTATATPAGGISPYSYLWSNAQTTQTATGLIAATYSVTVTDSHSCTFVASQTVSNTSGPVLALDSIHDENCFGDTNGDIFITVLGGTLPLNYLWSNASTNQDLLNVAANTYTVTVTDADNCVASISGTIAEPGQLSAATTSANSTCGDANGTATATPSGGTAPYTYLWSNAQTTQTATLLSAATYTVTVTDAHGCTFVTSQSVSNASGPAVLQDSIHNENCFGDSNGDIFISVTSGAGTMDYLWSDASTIEDLQNVIIGTYTVTVTDDNGCTATLSAGITQPSQLNATTSSNNSTCGNTNGNATVNPTGGISPYTYLWSNSQTTQTSTGLAAATYTVTVTDNNSCSFVINESVNDTPGPALSAASVNDADCYGNSDGSIDLTVNNGTPPFSYSWSNAATTEDISNLVQGNYTVTVTDFNSCTSSIAIPINQPDSISVSTNMTSSGGGANGALATFVTGGTAPYSYLWSTGATTDSIGGLTAGLYDLTVTDSHLCTYNRSVIVTTGLLCDVIIDSVFSPSCYNGNDGAIYIDVSGMVPPVTYQWSNGETTEDITNLVAGTYTVTVTDLVLCTVDTSIVVTQPDSITVNFSASNEACNSANGSITANPTGGTGPYSYLWSTTATTQTISNLSAATYTVTITDNNSCTKTQSASIINVSGPSLVLDSIIHVKCNGDSSGSIFIHVNGGTSPFNYLWSDASTNQNLINEIAGTYAVLVTDSNSCTDTLSAIISELPPLNDSTTTTSTACGSSTGNATVWPYGGAGSYTYLWSNTQTTQTITNLIAGPYTVTVTDGNNCTMSSIALVNNIGGPVIIFDSIFHVRCNGESNGSIFITPSGGTPGYSYFWSNGSTNQDIQNIPAGIYFLIVQDASNCIGTFTDTVFEPDVLTDSIIKANEICGNTNGDATVYPYGGTFPYQYQWSNGETTQMIDTLSAGTYTVTITDIHLCTKVSTVTILNIPPPSVNIDSVKDAKCFGDNNGEIYISVTGTAPPFSYLWTGGYTTQNITGLTSGMYVVTVTDTNLCVTIDSAFVNQPDSITITTQTTSSTCGISNGTATASATGGVFPYFFLWSNGLTTQSIIALSPGIYTVTVTDGNGCKDSAIAVVPSTGGAAIFLDSIVGVKCFGQSNGAIYITAVGTPTLTYFWTPNGATTDDNINIPFGTYIVFVFDGNNCVSTDTFVVGQPAAPLDDTIITVNETCGSGNGILTVNPFGGTFPYSFLWSDGQTTQTIDSLSAGTYTVTVTDFNGCTESSSASITNIPGPSLSDSIVHVKCFGDSTGAIYITVTGGTPQYTFLWSNGETTQNIVNVIAGNYSVVVTDSNSCKDTLFATITEPAALNATIAVTNETCGSGNGVLTANPFDGTSPYTFLWSNSDTTATTDSLSAGIYTVTITDFNGCTKVLSDTIINIPGFTINLDSLINVKCFGDSTGAIYVSPNGGSPLFSYLWSNAQTTDSLVGIPSGTYTVTVTDANNCKDSATYIINQPAAPLSDTILVTNASCGHADGSLTVNPSGGTGPYTFLWSTLNADTTQTISNLSANTYTVTVTDANQCTVISSATVGDNPGPLINVDSVITVKCNGENSGAIYVSVSFGTNPYSYVWSTGAADTTASVINLFAGIYTVTVTDANNCSIVDSIIVTQPSVLTDSVHVTDASCNTANGSATVYPYGGTGPYSIHWSTGDTTATITGLIAGTYTDTITDANGCIFIGFVNVSNVGGPSVALDSVKNVSCNGLCNGAIYITPSLGLPAYQFAWSNSASTEDVINLCAGIYTVTVTDAANCIVIDTFSVSEPDSLVLILATTPASCNIPNGSASVSPSGGTAPYNYVWSNALTTDSISGLAAGNYTVTVTDAQGCSIDTIVTISNPNSPAISNVVITNVKCFGEFTGIIDITVINGTPPYSFVWSNTFPTVTTEDLVNDTAGTYTVTVTDSANCTVSQGYIITQPPDLQISFTSIINPSCNVSNGAVTANVTGGTGTGTYTYLWSNNDTTSTITNLPAGSYTFTVTDGNQCQDSAIANLSNIAAPVITVIDSGMVSCYGADDGFINVHVTGGNDPYIYSWTFTSQTTPLISNLPGFPAPTGLTYTLTLTDSDTCVAVRSVTIFEPLPIGIPANILLQNGIYNIKCHGGNDGSIITQPTGGTEPFSYFWSYDASINPFLTNIPAGSYIVTVTDAHGCTEDSTFVLIEPPQLISDAGTDYVICGVSSDTLRGNIPTYGTGHWVVTEGNGIVQFPNSPVTLVTNLSVDDNNRFQWIVSDDSCSVSSQIIIRVNSAITAIPGADRFVCNDSIVLTAAPPQFGSGFWTIISGGGILVDSSVAQTSVFSLSLGENKFQWTVKNGNCIDSAIVTITLRNPEDCLAAIQLPTGITPNSDGKNDVFLVKGLEDYLENTIIIYNRWGNKVFEQSPYLNNWQGTNQSGGLLPEGTYFVILKIKGITKIFTGYIDLRR